MTARWWRSRAAHLWGLMHREPWWAELWSGLAMLVWSKWSLFTPGTLGGQPGYSVIAGTFPTDAFGFAGFVVGCGQMFAVCTDHSQWRFAAACCAGAFWLTTAWGIWIADRGAPGAGVYLVLGAANMGSMLLLTVQRRER